LLLWKDADRVDGGRSAHAAHAIERVVGRQKLPGRGAFPLMGVAHALALGRAELRGFLRADPDDRVDHRDVGVFEHVGADRGVRRRSAWPDRRAAPCNARRRSVRTAGCGSFPGSGRPSRRAALCGLLGVSGCWVTAGLPCPIQPFGDAAKIARMRRISPPETPRICCICWNMISLRSASERIAPVPAPVAISAIRPAPRAPLAPPIRSNPISSSVSDRKSRGCPAR
jgi:hypothetical protein